jgi:hypothetical protein
VVKQIRLAAAVVILGLSGCANPAPPTGDPDGDPGPPGYDVNRARWEEQGIDTYSFSLYLGSFEGPSGPFCGQGQVRIGIDGGVPVSVREPRGCVIDMSDPELGWVPFTIEEIFGLIKENGIRAEYDEVLGYPRAISSEGRLRHDGEVVFPVKGSGFELFVNDLAPGSVDIGSAADVLNALDEQRQIWQTHAIDSYRFDIERICFCIPGSYEVVVKGGQVTSVTAAKGGSVPPGSEELKGFPLTVPDLFDEIERWASADSIEVEYDAELGFPTRISVDPMHNAIDEEVAFVVTKFRAD